jgi:hypothetical protein
MRIFIEASHNSVQEAESHNHYTPVLVPPRTSTDDSSK